MVLQAPEPQISFSYEQNLQVALKRLLWFSNIAFQKKW